MGSATVTAAPGGSEDAGAVERVVQEAEAIETARVDGSLRAGIKKVKKKVGQGKVKEDGGDETMQQLALETIAAAEAIGMGGTAEAEEEAAASSKSPKRPAEGGATPKKEKKKPKQKPVLSA